MRKLLIAVPVLAAAALTAAAVPATAEQAATVAPGALVGAVAACVPDSTAPGREWFCLGTFTGERAHDNCRFTAVALVSSGRVTGATCAARNDGAGYDLWAKL